MQVLKQGGLLAAALFLGGAAMAGEPFQYETWGDPVDGAPIVGQAFEPMVIEVLGDDDLQVPQAREYMVLELIRSVDW